MPSLLLEIGTEELPASFVTEAQNSLSEGLAEALRTNNLAFDTVTGMSTPRRLAVVVDGLVSVQETTTRKIKGPPLATSFAADGTPNPAASGFAAKHNMTVEQLAHEQQGDLTYLVANVVYQGKPAAQVLQSILPKLISQLSGERMMRWGESDFKFSRPIRWLVALLDDVIVDFSVNGVASGRTSHGHRILHPQALAISHPSAYIQELLQAFVRVEPDKRRSLIEAEVRALATTLNGRPRQLSGSLLEEVVNITEWPRALIGDFADEYLDLPDALIETIMVHHQKYFPVEIASGKRTRTGGNLLPHFITVSNNHRDEAQKQIKQGNERVLKARLADGRFFYFDDQKTSLSDRNGGVSQLTFQEGLGSYGDKVARMLKVVETLALDWQLGPKLKVPLIRTLELCKSDLVTSLVRELPELQGHVGSWYAEQEGQPPEVVQAIASHYAPRFTEDAIPADKVGQLASVVDKADTLSGLFSMGKKPTGSSDPFALRRYAQGLVDVLMEGLVDVPINVSSLLKQTIGEFAPLVAQHKKSLSAEKASEELTEFLTQRIKSKLSGTDFRREIVDASISATGHLDYLPNISARCKALNGLIKSEVGIELIRAGVRIANIVRSGESEVVAPSNFSEPAEKALWLAYCSSFNRDATETNDHRKLVSQVEYEAALKNLVPLIGPVNTFFEEVMVNDEDMVKRKNRHAMLRTIYAHFNFVADFAKLQPIVA